MQLQQLQLQHRRRHTHMHVRCRLLYILLFVISLFAPFASSPTIPFTHVVGQCARESAYIREVTSQPDCTEPGALATLPTRNENGTTILLISCRDGPAEVNALAAVDSSTGQQTPLLSMEACGKSTNRKFTYDHLGNHLLFYCDKQRVLYEIHPNLTMTPFLASSDQCEQPYSFMSIPNQSGPGSGRGIILCHTKTKSSPTLLECLSNGTIIVRQTRAQCAEPLDMSLDEERGLLVVACQGTTSVKAYAVLPPSTADWSDGAVLTIAHCWFPIGVHVVSGKGRSAQWVVTCVSVLLLTPDPIDPLHLPPSITKFFETDVCQTPISSLYGGGHWVAITCSSGVILADFTLMQTQPLLDSTTCSGVRGVALTPPPAHPSTSSSSSSSSFASFDHTIFAQCDDKVVKGVSGRTHTRLIESNICFSPYSFIPDPITVAMSGTDHHAVALELLATCPANAMNQLISINGDRNHVRSLLNDTICYRATAITTLPRQNNFNLLSSSPSRSSTSHFVPASSLLSSSSSSSTPDVDLLISCSGSFGTDLPSMVRVSSSSSSSSDPDADSDPWSPGRYHVEPIPFPGCDGSESAIVDASTSLIVSQCHDGVMAMHVKTGSVEHIIDSAECKGIVRMELAPQTGMMYLLCPDGVIWLVNLTSFGTGLPHLQRSIFIDSTQCPQCRSMTTGSMTRTMYYASPVVGVMQRLSNGTTSRILSNSSCKAINIHWDPLFSMLAISCRVEDSDYAAVQVDPSSGHMVPIYPLGDCHVASIRRDPVTGAWLALCERGLNIISDEMRCTAGYTWSQGICVPCPVNSYRPAVPWNETKWSIGCTACPRGTIQNKTGSAMCDACPPGTYESNYVCTPCLPGYWQGSAGQTHCDICEAGYEAPDQGSSICTKCRKGHYAEKNGTAQCLECLPGRHAKSEGATICEECQDGFMAKNAAATECEPCKPGHYSGSPGAKSCSLCSPGSFQSGWNATSCDCCEPGRFSVATGSTNCSLCGAGYYSDRNASSFCQPCARGTASNETGRASSCPLCDAGDYQSGFGHTACLECEPSTYSSVPGAASCAECEQQVNANRTACTTNVCPANQEYSKITGKCVICPLGQYSSAGGSCTVCSVNSYTPHKGSGCISCLQAGMEGLICNGGLAAVREGWWAYLAGPDPATDMRLYRTQPCPHGYCPGSILQEGPSSPSSNSSQPSNGTSSTLICLPPRVNSLANTFCGQCEDGYIAWGDRCDKCDGADGGLLFAGVILSFLLVLFLLRAGTNAAGPIAILLYFVQIAALEVGPVSQWLTWLQAVNFDSASTRRCIAPWTPPQQTLATLLMPIILIVELGIIAAIHYCMHRRYQARVGWQNEYDETFLAQWLQGEQAPTAPPPSSSNSSRLHRLYSSFVRSFHRHRYLSGCISILLFCYTSIAVTCVRYLYCVDVDGHRILFFAPSIDCDSSEYKHYLIPVIVWMVVYVIAFPLIALIMLWRNRRSLYETTGSTSMPMPDVSQPSSTGSPSASPSSSSRHDQTKSSTPSTPLAVPSPLYQGFSPLFAMYAPHAWMYQPFVLLRRFAFALVSVLLIRQTASQFLSYALLHFASLQLHAWVQPYGSRLLNTIDTLSYSLLLVLSTMLTSYNPPYTPAVQTLLLLLIIPPAFILFLFILHQQFRTVHAKLKQKRQLRTGARPNTSGNDGNDDGIGAAPNTRTNETQQENEVDHESDHKSEEDEEYMHADRLELSAHPKQDRDRGREHYQLRRLARSMPTRATGPAPHVLSDADDEDDFPMHMVSIRM